jgi:hypothetical protein
VSATVCLCAKTLHYLEGGGHLWVYLNWALGLQANGCRVIWLEPVAPGASTSRVRERVTRLESYLDAFGLAGSLALCSWTGELLPREATEGCLDLEEALGADLLINVAYGVPAQLVKRFRRRVLLDIDPGLLQVWISRGQVQIPEHDLYFSIGETVGRPSARFPGCGLDWQYIPPCVALESWPVCVAPREASFTTVTHWEAGEWMDEEGEVYANDKKAGFLPFLDLPLLTDRPLELALCLDPDQREEWEMLRRRGWRVRHAWDVSGSPLQYRRYIQGSLAEFSCVKPSCIRFQNAWISDRTLCYLASGKPAVVQHTGPSRFLPDSDGLFRFRDMNQAASAIERVFEDYERQCRLARTLAEEYFDARVVAGRMLERALP